ncbi:yip7.2 family protein [Megaselia abdita]
MKTLILLSALLVVATASVARSPAVRIKDLLPGSRIVGGSPAHEGEFHYQVGLSYYNDYGTWWCGGSIIHAKWILTAAHCSEGATGVYVVAGTVNADPNEYDPSAQIRSVTNPNKIYINDDYNPANLNNDISLIELETPLNLDYYVWTVPLPNRSEANDFYEGQKVIASGWGKTGDYSPSPNKLRFADMYIMNHQKCKDYYIAGTVTDGVICTDTESGTRSTCQGDSGGPLVLAVNKQLIGVVSFVSTAGCESGGPDGFTRVVQYLDWIKAITGMNV